jgi:thiopeptide-type bacteriocin biosynthesis protein
MNARLPLQTTRKAGLDSPFRPSGFFALRTPLLPFQAFLDWSAGLAAPAAAEQKDRLAREGATLDTAVAEDRATLRRRLAELLDDPVVREAVFVASPDLSEAIEVWRREPASLKGQRAEEALVRYLSRMASRCTPFGLFAGCSVGRIGEANRLELGERGSYRRHARLDMDYLTSLTEALGRKEEVRRQVGLRPNPTLYRLGQRYRYAESRPSERGRSHHLVAVTATPYLDAVLGGDGAPQTFGELVGRLAAMDGVAADDAEAFLHKLLDNQALLPGIAPRLTGPEPTPALVESCRAFAATGEVAERLGGAQARFEAIDAEALGIDPERYLEIARELETLPAEAKLSRLFQVDLYKPVAHAELGPEVIESVLRGIEVLYYMAPAQDQNEVFRNFIAEFVKRYETQEIPLVEALDEEHGIGFSKSQAPGAEPSPLLEDVVFATASPDRTFWGLRERALLQMLLDAQARGDQEIELNPVILRALAGRPRPPLPNAFCAMLTVAAESEEAFREGKLEVQLDGASGPSGANLLGRFCHGDRELTARVEEHVASEEALDPDAVFAEVVHLPEGRVGNILLRPELRRYTIPLLGSVSEPSEWEIPITDLVVSVRQGRVELRSKRLGKRVHPRLTTAHGYFTDTNLGIYKFLCSLQWQGVSSWSTWSWAPFQSATFLPRVRFGNLILERAQWLLEQNELQELARVEDGARFREAQRLKEKRKLPTRFLLADADNELLVDLDNILSIDAFLAVVKKRSYCTVKELFPEPGKLAVRGPEGAFTCEILIPFVRRPAPTAEAEAGAAAEPVPLAMAPAAPEPIARVFPVGSEWLFAKIYTGTSTADWILRDVIAPLVAGLKAEGLVDRWHFIRYADPDFHLRVRFHGDPQVLLGQVFPRLKAALESQLASREVWRLQLDTYLREVERYGGPAGIELAEEIFQADSELVVGVISRVRGEALNDARWRLTLKGIDALLDDLGFDLEAKRRLMERVSEEFAREFHFKDTPLRHQISKKFRKEQAAIDLLLDPAKSAEHPLAPLFPLFTLRSRAWQKTIEALHAAAGELDPPLESIAISYVHMMANRLLRSANRAQELLIYSFLFRFYDSQLARRGFKTRKRAE